MNILDLKSPRPEAPTQHEPLPIRSTAGQDSATSAPAPWYRRGRIQALLSVVALAMLAAAWLIHGWLLSGNVVSLSNLELATVKRGTFVQDISARGTVIAAVSPTLVATAAGTVHYRVHPGDRVERGQILGEVDSPELENEYQRQLATLKSMNAALEQEQVRLREQLINSQQQANLAAVRMNAQLRDLQRAQAAWRVHVISERRYEAAYDAFSVARLDFENARDDAHLERQQILLSLRRRTLARDAQASRFAAARRDRDRSAASLTDLLRRERPLCFGLGPRDLGNSSLTARLIDRDGFRTRLGQLPASRFNREHLLRRSLRACTSPVHAIVPAVTAGELTESLRQQILRGIDVPIMCRAALRAGPLSDIEPQLIENMPASFLRAGLARREEPVHLDQCSAVPGTLVPQLTAKLSERRIVDRAGMKPAGQRLDVQVFNGNHIVLTHQAGRELMQSVSPGIGHLGVRSGDPQPLLRPAPAAFLSPREAPLLAAQVAQAIGVVPRRRGFLAG
jgi:hypothetical protein